jgi:hypothetical protein
MEGLKQTWSSQCGLESVGGAVTLHIRNELLLGQTNKLPMTPFKTFQGASNSIGASDADCAAVVVSIGSSTAVEVATTSGGGVVTVDSVLLVREDPQFCPVRWLPNGSSRLL